MSNEIINTTMDANAVERRYKKPSVYYNYIQYDFW